MKYISSLLLTITFALTSLPARAQIAPAYGTRLQTVLDSMCALHHIKGASAAVYVPGKGTWKGAHGDSYSGHPITTGMAFPFNSNTKTYTAALLLKLQEDGALQLSDTIGKWIHNQKNISGQITIRQMLNHTSGLYSYTDSSAFSDSLEANFARIWKPSEMLAFVGAPLFMPGRGWWYSNTNYLLAGMIIAQVTGMPVEQAIRTKLLTPQSLSSTWYYPQERPTSVIPHFWFDNGGGSVVDGAVAYGYTPEGFYSAASAAGALFGTAEDNVLFWHKMISGQVINATSLGEWRQMIPLSSTVGYGLGVFRYRNFNGYVVYEHGGTGAGAINENLADSVSGVCISVLTNQDSADNDILLNEVIRMLHSVTLDPPTAVSPVANSEQLTLFPSPAHDELGVLWHQLRDAGCSYRITDIIGRTVGQGKLDRQAVAAISVRELQNGIYYLTLTGNNGLSQTRQFAIAR